MKRFLTILLCILYTTVSFGGSVYMHNCCDSTSFSIYDKTGHDTCPMCAKKDKDHSDTKKHKSCSDGKCSDIEIKLDQLADKLFAGSTVFAAHFAPTVLTRYWINTKPLAVTLEKENKFDGSSFVYEDSSPPTFLLNCIFRI